MVRETSVYASKHHFLMTIESPNYVTLLSGYARKVSPNPLLKYDSTSIVDPSGVMQHPPAGF